MQPNKRHHRLPLNKTLVSCAEYLIHMVLHLKTLCTWVTFVVSLGLDQCQSLSAYAQMKRYGNFCDFILICCDVNVTSAKNSHNFTVQTVNSSLLESKLYSLDVPDEELNYGPVERSTLK